MDLKFDTICRVCLMSTQELENIFTEGLAQYIMTFALVKVNLDDGFPQCICKTCVEELRIAVRFKEKCEKSQGKLYEYLNSFTSIDTHMTINNINDYYDNNTKDSELYDDVSTILSVQDTSNILVNDSAVVSHEYYPEIKAEPTANYECISCKNKTPVPMCETCSKEIVPLKIEKEEIIEEKIKPKKKPHQCEHCGKITMTKSGLLRHMSIHLNERPYKCNKCEKAFRLKSFLTKHLLIHTGIKNHHCMFCSKSFVLKHSLTTHMQLHTQDKKYICHVCTKKFRSARTLQYHLKLHTGERNYPCSQCDKAFVNRFDLARHEKLHKKYQQIKEGTHKPQEQPQKMHQCEHCGKFFPNRSDMTKHFRVHTGIKPFKCQHCGMAFINTSALTVHVRTHTGVKPYKCPHCDQSFTQSSNLKVHVRLHTGDRPYVCTFCNKGFNRKRDLNTHVKKHFTDDIL